MPKIQGKKVVRMIKSPVKRSRWSCQKASNERPRDNRQEGLQASSNAIGGRACLLFSSLVPLLIYRRRRSYVCHIDSTSLTSSNATSLSQQTVFATPVSRLLPRIRLRTRQAPTLIGQKILVTIDRWDATSRYPEGHFVRALGKVESKEAEQESLLLEFEVPYRPFGKAILDCLPVEGDKWVVPPKSTTNPAWRDREDLRDMIICSIDPPSELLMTNIPLYMAQIGLFFLRLSRYR